MLNTIDVGSLRQSTRGTCMKSGFEMGDIYFSDALCNGDPITQLIYG